MDARVPGGATIEGLMARGSRRRLPALLLACLAALSSDALAADPEPSSDPLVAGEAAWDAGDYDGARAYFESALALAEGQKDGADLTEAEALGRIGDVLLEQGECRDVRSAIRVDVERPSVR